MTNDEIIRMAREAGAYLDEDEGEILLLPEHLFERFAALVAEATKDKSITAVKSVKTTFEAQDRILLEAVQAIRGMK